MAHICGRLTLYSHRYNRHCHFSCNSSSISLIKSTSRVPLSVLASPFWFLTRHQLGWEYLRSKSGNIETLKLLRSRKSLHRPIARKSPKRVSQIPANRFPQTRHRRLCQRSECRYARQESLYPYLQNKNTNNSYNNRHNIIYNFIMKTMMNTTISMAPLHSTSRYKGALKKTTCQSYDFRRLEWAQ